MKNTHRWGEASGARAAPTNGVVVVAGEECTAASVLFLMLLYWCCFKV
jgi:hypothetical protein